MFGSNSEFGKIISWGVLRIDIHSNYEKDKYLSELIKLSINNFYTLFGIKKYYLKQYQKPKTE